MSPQTQKNMKLWHTSS